MEHILLVGAVLKPDILLGLQIDLTSDQVTQKWRIHRGLCTHSLGYLTKINSSKWESLTPPLWSFGAETPSNGIRNPTPPTNLPPVPLKINLSKNQPIYMSILTPSPMVFRGSNTLKINKNPTSWTPHLPHPKMCVSVPRHTFSLLELKCCQTLNVHNFFTIWLIGTFEESIISTWRLDFHAHLICPTPKSVSRYGDTLFHN